MYIYKKFGGLAHLARALAWQARGNRFDSGILHKQYQALQRCEAFFVDVGWRFRVVLSVPLNRKGSTNLK